jgi:hypothetical protein
VHLRRTIPGDLREFRTKGTKVAKDENGSKQRHTVSPL